MPKLVARVICETAHVCVRDVRCTACRGGHQGSEECDSAANIVFPYRGSFIRRLGTRSAQADPNQALFFNPGEGYRVDHPNDDGDDCLSIRFAPQWLEELGQDYVAFGNGVPAFREAQSPISPATQLIVSRMRHAGPQDAVQLEHCAVVLCRELFGRRPGRQRISPSRRRLVERAKRLLHSQPQRRWSLSELASELATSPVYLTQTFSDVEGTPLYRYQTRLRLAGALNALPECDDLATLALDRGFSSHSQFTAAFLRSYGVTPSSYRREVRGKQRTSAA